MRRILAVSLLLLMSLISCNNTNKHAPVQARKLNFPTPPVYEEMQSIGDGGLFSNHPCASPCFFSIRIGETSLEEIASLLEDQNISPCHNYEEVNIMCGIGFFANVWITVDVQTSTVNGIGYDPSISISVSDIVEKYGNPNYVLLFVNGIPELPQLSLSIFWDSIRMIVDLPTIDDTQDQKYVIEPSTEVRWISFYNDIDYSSQLKFVQIWNDYGIYQP